MPYQTVDDFYIDFVGMEKYSNYHRELNLDNATITTTYNANGLVYKRDKNQR
jgi:alpha-L-fucosidase 2